MSGRLLSLVVLCLAALCVSPWIGPSMPAESADFILWQLRVPRVLVGALVGGTLGIVGAAYQTIFGNPLATPSTVGTTAGAVLGALAAAQIFAAACAALPDIPEAIARGDFAPLMGWLGEQIHSQGSRVATPELIVRATGAPLGTAAFKAHLERRYLGS